MTTTARLALGTVQFGLAYGINNVRGQVPEDEVRPLLQIAWAAGIDTLDTAYAYGDSEAALGRAFDPAMDFRIVSKYPAHEEGQKPAAIWKESCRRLGRASLYGYLLHNYAASQRRSHLLDFLQELRAKRLVQRTGFSLYHPDELCEILQQGIPFELVQVPLSILDQRFVPYFPELQKRGVEVHVRSAFLQGLVFRDPASLPAFFRPALGALGALREHAAQADMSLAQLCLGFCLAQRGVDRVVVGVDGIANLRENIACAAEGVARAPFELAGLALDAPNILNPARWEKS